jgi:DNA-binding NtrC family response regulator
MLASTTDTNSAVLLVDDDPNILYSLSRVLRGQPIRLYTARSAEEATAILKSQTIHLVVSDEGLPGIKGTVFLTWVAQKFPDVCRIVLTGQPFSVSEAIQAADSARVFRFLTKPCDSLVLARAIRDGLQHGATGA